MKAPEFWRGGRENGAGEVAAALLAPVGAIWAGITTARATRSPEWTAPVPVVCVGNVVAGGAGKTQVAADLLGRLATRGFKVHALLRGYGARISGPLRVESTTHTFTDVGDEALLLAATAPTWVGADRVSSAKAAVDAGAEIIVMDDGFQNSALAKTISLLVIDGEYGFGNGRTIPAGPLREEPDNAFKRAAALCVLGGAEFVPPTAGQALPRFDAHTVCEDAAALEDARIIAFAGIGRPEKFFRTLTEAGAEVVRTVPFADHHPFGDNEIQPLIEEAESTGCRLVTTAKDHVRLPGRLRSRISPVPVRLAWNNEAAFERFVLSSVGLM